MTTPVILRRLAQREFDDAADWYEQQRVGLGAEFIEEVNRVLEQIAANPQLYGQVHNDTREALVRRFPYALYYRIEPNQVLVLAIVHTSRDPAVWQSRS